MHDSRYFTSEWGLLPEELPARLREVRASDVMTREIVAVTPDTPIVDVARVMREQHVHRVLVIENHELIGLLTTFDLLRAFVDDQQPRRMNGVICEPIA